MGSAGVDAINRVSWDRCVTEVDSDTYEFGGVPARFAYRGKFLSALTRALRDYDNLDTAEVPDENNLPYPVRVIDTHTLQFESDYSLYKDRYAILSHTWIQEEEVTYATAGDAFSKGKLQSIRWLENKAQRTKDEDELLARLKGELQKLLLALLKGESRKLSSPVKGTAKLLGAVDKARNMGFRYLWMDNCCIDKSNKAEEQISLQSMGSWYTNAAVCLVFLDDLALLKEDVPRLACPHFQKPIPIPLPLRWATRGWTLQEIILSRRAVFLNRDWKEVLDTDPTWFEQSIGLGSRERARVLYNICQIPAQLVCCGGRPVADNATILTLAASRSTTVEEDRIYSLMGMLGVRLRVNYGEGLQRAVARLCKLLAGAHNLHDGAPKLLDGASLPRSIAPFSPMEQYLSSKMRQDQSSQFLKLDVRLIRDIQFSMKGSSDVSAVEINGNEAISAGSRLSYLFFDARRRCGSKRELHLLFPAETVNDVDGKHLFNWLGGKTDLALARYPGDKETEWFLCELTRERIDGQVLATYGRRIRHAYIYYIPDHDEIETIDVKWIRDSRWSYNSPATSWIPGDSQCKNSALVME